MALTTATDTLRIDRWLFYCRFFKTRVMATAAVGGGHIELNGVRASPGHRVRRGDTIEMLRERLPYSLKVLDIPTRRGPAAEARPEADAKNRWPPRQTHAAQTPGAGQKLGSGVGSNLSP